MTLVLVTGISGYLASHVANELLKSGYRVRGTVRSLQNEDKVKPIRELSAASKYPIELVEADLLDENCWKNIVKDCEVVFHVASPLPIQVPSDEQEIIKPAVEGTLNVLRAAVDTNVKRVVVTSSGLTITGMPYENDKVFDEKCWADPNKNSFYCKSKILSEKAAWNFVEERKKANQSCFELSVICPTFILGPVLHNTISTSSYRFLNVLQGKLEKLPDLYFATCDVRDVALAHVRAGFLPKAAGERILIVSENNLIPMKRWSEILNEEFAGKGFKIPTEVEPGPAHGKTSVMNNSKMKNILGIIPTDFRQTVIQMAESLIARGFLEKNK